jgi:hypothetical protein
LAWKELRLRSHHSACRGDIRSRGTFYRFSGHSPDRMTRPGTRRLPDSMVRARRRPPPRYPRRRSFPVLWWEEADPLRSGEAPGQHGAHQGGANASCHSLSRLHPGAQVEARFLLWKATGDRSHLEAAHELLVHRRDHAPPEHRETMIVNVPLHRDIQAAWDVGGRTSNHSRRRLECSS